MKVIDDDDASLQPKIGADGFPLGGTVTRARDYRCAWHALGRCYTSLICSSSEFKLFWTFSFAIHFICNSSEKLEIKMKLTQMLLLLLLELLLLLLLLLLHVSNRI